MISMDNLMVYLKVPWMVLMFVVWAIEKAIMMELLLVLKMVILMGISTVINWVTMKRNLTGY